ncbi:Small glutamine-rich tetratricopeptide repeat-containing protein alpha [Taenia crassiceps]|uniref:Small glutamine-rich tetratricopeptide repeat-containing protein alpha n=1 Tax=Taenia crassiceps TaxID=6207 RepID=A0ABR4QCF7_9CEST
MISETKRKLYQCIAAFLKDECCSSEYSGDTIESLEVAKQCIESAFGVSGNIEPIADLLALFEKSLSSCGRQVSPEDKAKAENLKSQGNSFMALDKFDEAIDCYSQAIALDPGNAIYYCNRAAAKSRLNKDKDCIEDCEKALEIDPTYSKAYGRMGLAYCSMAKYEKAIEAYKKAVSLDPNNLNFKQSLALAEANLKQSSNAGSNNFGNLDFNALLNNPMMQSMAQRLISDPQMQSTVSSMVQGIFSGGNAPTEGNGTPSGVPNMDDLLRYGQQFAQQMRQTNPDLVDALRQQMQNVTGQQSPSNDTKDAKDDVHEKS